MEKLLEVWSDEKIQAQLRGSVRNEIPFRKIADELCKAGYDRSSKQCREKIKALKKKYKEIVDRLRRSGVGLESDDEDVRVYDFKWFTEIHAVMKGRASANPKHVVDSATYAAVPANQAVMPSTSAIAACSELQSSHEQSPLESDHEDSLHSSEAPNKPQATSNSPRKKKRNLTKVDKAERASSELIHTLLKAQTEQQQKMEEIERERMKKRHRRRKREKVYLLTFLAGWWKDLHLHLSLQYQGCTATACIAFRMLTKTCETHLHHSYSYILLYMFYYHKSK